jgi:hypothetical protein
VKRKERKVASASGPRRIELRSARLLIAFVVAGLVLCACASTPDDGAGAESAEVSEARPETASSGSGRLEPTYQPREPVPEPWYNSDYIFGMTRGVANSSIAPGGKVPLFVLTIPLDIVTLPFSLIGGFFG